MDDFTDALRKLRTDRRSFNELEKLIGLPAETIRDIARGTTLDPRISKVRKIMRFYSRQAA